MKAKPIKEILSDFFQGTDFQSINESISLEKEWGKMVGELIAKNTEITSFSNGRLTVKTSNPVWRNELTLQKPELIQKLNQIMTDTPIKEIIFR
ncbi:MAG: DUF721 domain-containing protein [Candidatus Marinimicrobia bacterium]|nr:DUF721 domain-containing protein [Candidatus Neomarinimicrobiota bacterium]